MVRTALCHESMRKTTTTTTTTTRRRRRRMRRRMCAPHEDREPTRRGVTTTVGRPPRIFRDRSNHHSPTRRKQRPHRLRRRFRSITYVARNFVPHNGVRERPLLHPVTPNEIDDYHPTRTTRSKMCANVAVVLGALQSFFIRMRMIRMSSLMRTDPHWVTA